MAIYPSTQVYPIEFLLACGNCGVSYRRITERGKVVWRCVTRIEKGKVVCSNSPTLNEEWANEDLSEMVCDKGVYEENIIRNKIDKIQIFAKLIIVCCKDELQFNARLDEKHFCSEIPANRKADQEIVTEENKTGFEHKQL